MMEAGSKILYSEHLKLNVDLIHMRAQSLVSADTVSLSCSEALLEGGSVISTTGRGPASTSGPGAGKVLSNAGSGGGHGGEGGPSTTIAGGSGYGSYLYPLHPGSGGGGTSGGRGGSTIQVTLLLFNNITPFILNIVISSSIDEHRTFFAS